MNYIVLKGKLNGKWSNGVTGEKRGLNLLIVEEMALYKVTLWREEADWADTKMFVGDEIILRGQVSGLYKNDDKILGIELSAPEFLSINSYEHVKADLLRLLNQGTSIQKETECNGNN